MLALALLINKINIVSLSIYNNNIIIIIYY